MRSGGRARGGIMGWEWNGRLVREGEGKGGRKGKGKEREVGKGR